MSAEALNLFDSKSDDIAYYYASRCPTGSSLRAAAHPSPPPACSTSTFTPSSRSRLRGSLTVHF